MIQQIVSYGFFSFSKHATRRSQQRGIPPEVIMALLDRFDIDHPVGKGCYALSCSRTELARARADGISASMIEYLGRVVLVTSDDGVIITTINRETKFARFQRGHARLSARERSRKASRRRRVGGIR